MNNYYRMDGWLKSELGPAIAGAQIWVCTQPANVFPPVTPPRTTPVPWLGPNPQAQIYSDNGTTQITQPIQSDGFGHYDFYALPGLYTIVIIYGGKVRQYYVDQSLGGAGSAGTPPVVPTYPGNAALFLNGAGVFSAPPTAATMTNLVGGLVPTPPNDATKFLSGTGVFSTPPAPATMTNVAGGLVPTPPNDATKFLNGTGVFSTPPYPTITLKTNSTTNGSQTLLNLVDGTGMHITQDNAGNVTVTNTLPSPVLVATLTMTPAQIRAANTTRVPLIAGVPGKIITPITLIGQVGPRTVYWNNLAMQYNFDSPGGWLNIGSASWASSAVITVNVVSTGTYTNTYDITGYGLYMYIGEAGDATADGSITWTAFYTLT